MKEVFASEALLESSSSILMPESARVGVLQRESRKLCPAVHQRNGGREISHAREHGMHQVHQRIRAVARDIVGAQIGVILQTKLVLVSFTRTRSPSS